MARVIYVGKSDAVDLVDGTRCERNTPVEVSDALGASLLEQDIWRAAPAPTTPKPNKPAEPEKESAK